MIQCTKGALGVPINVIISYMDGIVIKMNNSKEVVESKQKFIFNILI